jgi:chaperone LolA
MKTLIIILTVLMSITLLGESVEEIKTVKNKLDETVLKIKESYEKVDVLEAEFEQIFFHKAYKRKKKSSGSVIFTKDLKMKWSYKTPEKKYIISNGEILWIYEPENEQAFKTNIKGSELESAGKFLLGKMEILNDYNIKQNDNTLILKPKNESNYKTIYLTINKDYRVVETKMIDNFDNENIIKYKNFKLNENKLTKEFFDFIPPDDTEIIEKEKE